MLRLDEEKVGLDAAKDKISFGNRVLNRLIFAYFLQIELGFFNVSEIEF